MRTLLILEKEEEVKKKDNTLKNAQRKKDRKKCDKALTNFMTTYYAFLINVLISDSIPALFLTYLPFVESSWHRHGQYLFSAPIVPVKNAEIFKDSLE